MIPSGLPRPELEDMNRRGMRGCRMSTVVSGGASFAHLRGLAEETFDLGWHLVLHFNAATELVDVAPQLLQIRSPFVLDHLARISAAEGVNFRAIPNAAAAARYRPLLDRACQPLSPVVRTLSPS